jgi:3-methyladenine DNA glycosylase Tag
MICFKDLEEQAAAKHGGLTALKRKLRKPLPKKEIASIPSDRYLSELSKITFQIGFNWNLVDKKWPSFEQQFFGFDISYYPGNT